MQPSLLLIVAFLGRLPTLFDLWLESCRRNPHVDWLVATDQPQQGNWPPNVHYLHQTREQLIERMNEQVGVSPTEFRPYKLCDYKITYGVMFEEELQGYDYWGVCDLDVIFGDLAAHFDLNDLAQYTKLFWYGHLTIYRNTPEVNNAFRLPGPGWNALEELRIPHFRSLDEKAGILTIWRLHGLPFYHENLAADILSGTLRMRARRHPNAEHQVFGWIDGRVMCYQLQDGRVEEQEFMYIHFQKRWMPRGDVRPGESFFLTPNGIVAAGNIPPTADEVVRLATPTWQARREFAKRRVKDQIARVKRHYAGEKILAQPPPEILPPDTT